MLKNSHSGRLEIAKPKICKGVYSAFQVSCCGMATPYGIIDEPGPFGQTKMFEQSNLSYIEHWHSHFYKKILFNKCMIECDNIRAQTK